MLKRWFLEGKKILLVLIDVGEGLTRLNFDHTLYLCAIEARDSFQVCYHPFAFFIAISYSLEEAQHITATTSGTIASVACPVLKPMVDSEVATLPEYLGV